MSVLAGVLAFALPVLITAVVLMGRQYLGHELSPLVMVPPWGLIGAIWYAQVLRYRAPVRLTDDDNPEWLYAVMLGRVAWFFLLGFLCLSFLFAWSLPQNVP